MPLKMEERDIVPCVEVKIEIAHRASLRAKPTKEGFTHDWTVYVRGQEDCNISQFVEKVVFHLHHTFANPRRVVKVPPYYVSEVGYAGFNLPIEIFFKSKTEPRKIMFNYDLFLQMYEPVSFVRCEKLTFQKPTDEFKETLINAGGVLVLPPGETQSADLCGPPAKTESPKKQKQPLTSKENVSKQMLNFSGNEKTSNSGKDSSASLKSSVKQERIDNNSKDHDAALSRQSNSSSKMVSNPAPLPSQKRPSDSPIPSENKQKKARRSSSMSSEKFRSEDKQKYEEKENKDKVKRKGSENKDESHSEYKDGKDCHKMDTSKQKSSKNSKEKKKESNLMKDGKKEAKDDKREVRDDKKELMNDKKELKKDIKDDKKDVKDVKSSVKQERIDNNSKDHDAALSRQSNSSSKMVSNPAPLPSQKRPSDSPIPSENKQKKARRSSSMSSERFRSEDKQKYEEKENKDKVMRKGSENKDESHSEYKNGKDCHKMDTSKQKSSKNSEEKKKESNLMKDGKKEAKDDKREVRDDKKELMNDKKELKKDIKDDKKDVKDVKSSVKQERIDNNSKDHDAALSRQSNSSSKMVSNPAPLPSQKRPSDSPIPSENKQKKARRSSSMSSERFRSEDKQKYEEKENKDKVMRKGSENKDESHSEYKNGKDCHKMDTSKQKSSKNSEEKKKESNLMKDGKKEAKDDKREVRDDKKELMNDKKELKKDIKDDKKDVKDDYKVKNDTKEVKDGKRKVQNDKNESINKTEVKNDQKKVKQDKIKIINDRKDVKDDRKGHKEVKENKKEVKEVKDGKQEVIAKTSSKTSERRKQDDKCKVEIKVNIDKEKKSSGCEHSSSESLSKGENEMKENISNRNKKSEITTDAKKARSEHRKRPGSPLSALDGSSAKNHQDGVKHLSKVTSVELKENLSHQSETSNQIYYKSALQKLMDELEDISSDDEDDFTTTVIFSQRKSSSTKSVSEKESSNISDTRKKTQNWIQPLTQSPDPITKSKEAKSTSTGDSIFDVKSQNKTAVKDLVVKTKSSTECEHSSSKPSSKGDNDKENISNRIIQSETKKAKSEHRSGSPVSAVDGSMAKTWDNNVKHLSKVTSVELIEDLFLSSDSSSESDDDFGGESSGSDLDLDISPTASTNKNSNPISSKSPLQILMDELKNILSDDGDISATKTVVKDLDMKQKPNEDKIRDTKKANTKENNFVTSNISSSEQAPNGEELIQLSELKKILMGITDLSVLQKAVKLILSTGYFEIKDTFDSDLLALNLNAISQLQSFVATKL